MPDSIQLTSYRQQFPALANKAYFNYGGQGPMPQTAIAAVQQAHEYIQQIGPFSNAVNLWMNQEMQKLREAIASDLNVAAQTISLTESVSAGCNIALWGIDWQQGDHMLLSDCEHPGIIAVALEIQRRFGVEVSMCPLLDTLNGGDPVAVITQHLRPTTRLVVISHILWNTGQVLPLAEICTACHAYPTQSNPVRVLVDAAQSVGVLPLKLAETEVDFYAFTGHKWLCGPAGAGGFYARPEALDSISPTFVVWRAITKDKESGSMGWEPSGRRFEVATSDCGLYVGLREAIAHHHQWGSAEARYQRILSLSQYLWQQLNNLPQVTCLRTAPPESGLVSFQVQHPSLSHSQIVQRLEKQGFYLRTILSPDCIRACVHYFTLESEIDQLLNAIQALPA
ncbi:MAG TPA: aminotransferase class V-fold PLP-dependent enzyme [Crinalium sp.]